MENKLIIPQDVYNRIEADSLAWSENQYGHDDVNKDYLEGALHEAMIAQAEYVRLKAPTGPRWVKAIDRNPPVNTRLHLKVKGVNHVGFWDAPANCYVTFLDNAYPITDVEWLDEQPNSSPVCEPDFIEFVKNERNEISKEMLSDEWWLEIPTAKRVKFENVLIAYDQMVERLKKSQPAAGREEDDGTMYDATWGYPT